jgi:mannosyltransferase
MNLRWINKTHIILLLILILATVLRFHGLSTESYWLDETVSIDYAKKDVPSIIDSTYSNETHPPLYYILLHFWINLFGTSEIATRSLSAVFGIFSILIIYKVAENLFDNYTGIISALLLAISPFHIFYSQETRMYSQFGFFTLVSMFFFVKYLKNNNTWNLTAYAVSNIILLYSHVYGIFIIISQNIFFFVQYYFIKKPHLNTSHFIFAQVISIACYSVWAIGLFFKATTINQSNWCLDRPSLSEIPSTIIKLVFYQLSIIHPSLQPLFIIALFVLIASSVLIWKKNVRRFQFVSSFQSLKNYSWSVKLVEIDKLALLLIWLIIPICLGFVISQIVIPIYNDKYFIGASLSLLIILARGLSNISGGHIKAVAIILLIVSSAYGVEYDANLITKSQWREVVQYVEKNAKPTDLILMVEEYVPIPFNTYAHRKDLQIIDLLNKTNKVNNKTIAKINQSSVDRIWLIVSQNRDNNDIISNKLHKTHELAYYEQYVGIRVYLFKKYAPIQNISQQT